jgi:hypothetical protein
MIYTKAELWYHLKLSCKRFKTLGEYVEYYKLKK